MYLSLRIGRRVRLLPTRMFSAAGFGRCLLCKSLFAPDPRNRRHQRFCSQPACRSESKRQAQARWLAKPENQNHFKGFTHVARVQAWRAQHPGYWKRAPAKPVVPLQDLIVSQPVEPQPTPRDLFTLALQDLSSVQTPLLVGLIARTLGSTLQDDIARLIHGLVAMGQDLLDLPSRRSRPQNDTKKTPRTAPPPQNSGPVKLGGSTPHSPRSAP